MVVWKRFTSRNTKKSRCRNYDKVTTRAQLDAGLSMECEQMAVAVEGVMQALDRAFPKWANLALNQDAPRCLVDDQQGTWMLCPHPDCEFRCRGRALTTDP